MVLYVLLSGCFPFEGHDVKAKLMQDYKFSAATWTGVSERAKAFISTLLCAPPRLRPPTERVLDHPWLTDPDNLPRTYLRCVVVRGSTWVDVLLTTLLAFLSPQVRWRGLSTCRRQRATAMLSQPLKPPPPTSWSRHCRPP